MLSVTRRLVATAAMFPLAIGLVAAEGETELRPVTETLFISAGCPSDGTPTCTSTRWLGKVTGDSSSNFLTATTPVDEAQYRATGAINWRDYASDLSLSADGYLLDTSRPLEIDVTVSTGGNGGIAANGTAHARISVNHCDKDADGALVGCKSTTLNGEDQTFTIAGVRATETVEFDLELAPATFDGRWLRRATVEIAVHGINAQGGYIDQQGGSPVRIPYLLEVEAAA